MKISALAMVLLLLHCSPSQISTSRSSFDLGLLDDLTPWKSQTLAETASRRYLLVIYYSVFDCGSCVQRETRLLQQFQKAHDPDLDYAVVIFDPETKATDINPYLNDMRRVGRLKGPILLERVQGSAGLGNALALVLIDRNRQEVCLRYTPVIEKQGWPEFERRLLDILGKG